MHARRRARDDAELNSPELQRSHDVTRSATQAFTGFEGSLRVVAVMARFSYSNSKNF